MAETNGTSAADIKAAQTALDDEENKSVQGRADKTEWAAATDVTSGAPFAFMVNIMQAADEIPPWDPIYPNRRDMILKHFTRQETALASAIYTLKTKTQTLNYELNGPARAKQFAQDLLNNPGMGDSFIQLVGKIVDDLLCADNGAFIELWRLGDPKDESSPIIGFGHIDSRQCWRTFDPEWPVIYTNPQTAKRYKLHRNQVIMTADNIQPIEIARGIGFCATSRVLQWARVIRSIMTYTDEKISGRFTRAIGFVNGITKHSLKAGLSQSKQDSDDAGFFVYNGIPFFAAPGMSAGNEMNIVLQDLASIPDGFDFERDITLYAYILAWVFGTDARDFWPATTSGATKGDATVQNMKSRGKGIGWLIQTLEWIFRQLIPASVSFEYDFSDDEQDLMQTQIQTARVGILNTLRTAGAIESWEMRALAAAEGIVDQDVLDSLTPPATSDDMETPNTMTNPENPNNPEASAGAQDDSQTDEQGEGNASSDRKDTAAKTAATFQRSLNAAIRGLWAGTLTPMAATAAAESAIRRGIIQGAVEGTVECGISQEEWTGEEWEAVNLFIMNQYHYLPGFLSDVMTNSKANGGELTPLLDRVYLWVNQYGAIRVQMKTMACGNKKMIWTYGATEDHCDTCSFYVGKVYRNSIWKKYLDPYDMLPHGSGLACGGHYCDCDLTPTDLPVTKGRPAIWKAKKSKRQKKMKSKALQRRSYLTSHTPTP